jgi:hypothetical protein
MGDKWPWSNTINGSVSVAKVGGTPGSEWISRMVRDLCRHRSLVWGAAYATDEFRASNLHDNANGT